MELLPAAITIFLTFVSPFINAWIQDVNWSPKTKNLLAIIVSLVIAVAYLIMTGGIADWSQLGIVVPAVYGLQQAIYNFLLKNIATKFEAVTTKGSVVVAPSEEAGKVDVVTDQTIEANTTIQTDPPVTVSPEPIVITKDDTVG